MAGTGQRFHRSILMHPHSFQERCMQHFRKTNRKKSVALHPDRPPSFRLAHEKDSDKFSGRSR